MTVEAHSPSQPAKASPLYSGKQQQRGIATTSGWPFNELAAE